MLTLSTGCRIAFWELPSESAACAGVQRVSGARGRGEILALDEKSALWEFLMAVRSRVINLVGFESSSGIRVTSRRTDLPVIDTLPF